MNDLRQLYSQRYHWQGDHQTFSPDLISENQILHAYVVHTRYPVLLAWALFSLSYSQYGVRVTVRERVNNRIKGSFASRILLR